MPASVGAPPSYSSQSRNRSATLFGLPREPATIHPGATGAPPPAPPHRPATIQPPVIPPPRVAGLGNRGHSRPPRSSPKTLQSFAPPGGTLTTASQSDDHPGLAEFEADELSAADLLQFNDTPAPAADPRADAGTRGEPARAFQLRSATETSADVGPELPAPSIRSSKGQHDRAAPGDSLALELSPAGDPLQASTQDLLDLPEPARRPISADLPELPDPARRFAPADWRDLPGPPRVSAPELPAMRGLGDPALDLPELDLLAPAGSPSASGSSGGVLGELDLPAPADLDLPVPATNLLAPADLELPIPVDTDFLTPAAAELEPRHDLLQPAADLLQPAAELPLPKRAAPRHPAAVAEAENRAAPVLDRRTAQPPTPGSRASRRWAYGIVGVVFAGAAVVGAQQVGLFGDETDGSGARGISQKADDDIALGAGERDDATLSNFAQDTPASYAAAIKTSRTANDEVAQAESLLLLHYRYGPDDRARAEALGLLERFADHSDGFVQRVLGLAALASEQLDAAEKRLSAVDDTDPRVGLYRAWLLLAQGQTESALRRAENLIAANPGDLAALQLRHEATPDPLSPSALEALAKDIATHPEHPGLRELYVRRTMKIGFLARARQHVGELSIDESTPEAYRARIARLRAGLERESGNGNKALAILDEARRTTPQNVDLQIDYVRELLAAGNLTAATDDARTLAKTEPDHPLVAELLIEVAIASGDGDGAMAIIEAQAAKGTASAALAYLQGQVHAMRSQLDEAKAAFATALQRDPEFVAAYLAEADMLTHARQQQDALQVLDRAATTVPSSAAIAAVLTRKAELLVAMDQHKAAIKTLDNALQTMPTANAAQLLRGKLLLMSGDYQRGRADLLDVFERAAEFPGLIAQLGRILAREGQIEQLEKLVGDRASDPDASNEVKLVGTRLALAKDDTDTARALLEDALARDSSNWEAHMLRSQLLLQQGDPAGALEAIENSRPTKPQSERMVLRGKVLEFNNRHDEASAEYLGALKLEPDNIEARFLYGRLLAYAGAAKKAVTQLARVVEQTNAYPAAWLAMGRAQRDLGKQADAIASLETAQRLDPDLYEAFYLEGRLRYDRNEHSQAIGALEHAVDDGAADQYWYADAWMYLARAQLKGEQKRAAKGSLTKFLEVAPDDHPSRKEANLQLRKL